MLEQKIHSPECPMPKVRWVCAAFKSFIGAAVITVIAVIAFSVSLIAVETAQAIERHKIKTLVGRATGILPWDLTELSGMAQCESTPGLIYAINDKGNEAKLYTVDEAAKMQTIYPFLEDKNKDWEDLACGKCIDSPSECVYIGDIGSNNGTRKKLTVYMVPVPILLQETKKGPSVVRTKIKLKYPNGSHNAETLLAHPKKAMLLVVTKEKGPKGKLKDPRMFQIDFTKEQYNGDRLKLADLGQIKMLRHLERSDPASSSWITGGDFHPSGDWMLLMTYTFIFRVDWPLKELERKRVELPLFSSVDRSQIESIAFHRNGRQFWIASEMNRWSEPLILMELPKEGK